MYEEQISAYFDDPARQRELVEAVCRLVSIRSVREEPLPGKPFGEGPARALDEALALCGEMGFATGSCDGYVGTADLNGLPTQLHILGHLDVVGEGKGWDSDPYGPVEKDGLLIGRGVADDKGPMVAALFAMRAVRDLNIPLKYNVRAILGTDEESGSSDIAYYFARNPYAPLTFSPDADFPVINIEKGHYHPDFGMRWDPSDALPRVTAMTGGFRTNVVPPEARAELAGLTDGDVEPLLAAVSAETGAEFALEAGEKGVRVLAMGRNAHASTPDEGCNAITALLDLLSRLPLADCGSTGAVRALHALFPHGDNAGRALGIAQSDALSGALTLNFAIMSLDETGFTGKFDVRYPICADEGNCKAACEASFARHGISVTGDGEMAPGVHHTSADSPFVQTLLDCYVKYTGDTDARPLAIGGGTYVHDIPGGVAFGCQMPGFDPKMHGANERIPVADLVTSCKIFAQAIAQLCG